MLLKQQNFYSGVLLTFGIAGTAYFLATLPGFSIIGPLALAIILAIIIRNFIYNPTKLAQGITFSAKKILRFAIILYGVKLNMVLIYEQGLGFIGRAALVVAFAISVMLVISHWMKIDKKTALLLGCGTGICGGAAIGAVAPIVKSSDEETALSVGMISLVGTAFALMTPVISNIVGMSAETYGQWVGFSVHEIAHAALAGGAYGEESMTAALMAKLSRVLLLFPVTLIIAWFIARKTPQGEVGQQATFPYFIVGFLIVSIISTTGLQLGFITPAFQAQIGAIASFLLAVSMAALGLTINLKQLTGQALKPLLLLVITSVLVFIFTFIIL